MISSTGTTFLGDVNTLSTSRSEFWVMGATPSTIGDGPIWTSHQFGDIPHTPRPRTEICYLGNGQAINC